jgi:hypothetical protein
VGGVVVEDDVNRLASRHLGLYDIEETNEFLMTWRCMLRPMTVSSRTVSAANRVVVPWALVIVRHRAEPTFFSGSATEGQHSVIRAN